MLLSASVVGRAEGQDTFTGVERIVAVGDVHGDFNQFVTILRHAGVIDGKNRWIGGGTHLVQTGDILDRGPKSRAVMDLLIALTPQAAKAGGRVHALIGNHEAMNVLGDLRYVSAEEYWAFKSPNAEKLRDRVFKVMADSSLKNDAASRERWEAEHPLGWVEHRLAFEGNGHYGTWIRGNNAAVKINDNLFLHGGIGPNYAGVPLAELNAKVRAALAPDAPADKGNIAEDPEGPLWFRGLATGDEVTLSAHLDSVLAAFGVSRLVIGHTVTAGAVMPRFGGKVLMIDVGLSATYGGPAACLVIERGKRYALHRGQQLEIPESGDLLPYLRAAAALDPAPSRLTKLIEQLDPSTTAAPPPTTSP
ncbi:MAG: metallophosphoesterase [Gemmatimonadales bacterium]